MIQEKREMAIGLQLGPSYAMLTSFTPGMKEPQTLETSQETEDDRYLIPLSEEVWKAAKGQGEPIEKLTGFLSDCLDRCCRPHERSSLRIMVTVPKLDRLLGQRIPTAFELLGLKRRQIHLQDHLSSFYYYTVNQRKDLWNSDVALLEYDDETMLGYILHIDSTKVPALVTVRLAARQTVGSRERDGRDDRDWDRERDRLLFELLKKLFAGRQVGTVYILGSYYSSDWAPGAFQYMCGGRHAFQGMNLYTKGACYAAMERAGMLRMPDMLFVGDDIVRENLGMMMRIRGREVYYPLVTAGVNWYEAHHECEFINDGERSICITGKPMTGGDEVTRMLRLDHLPDRPARAARFRMTLYFTAPDVCVVEVEDLGFGGLFKSSGKTWKREIHL